MTDLQKSYPAEPTVKARLVKLITAQNAVVFLSGLACFILAMSGKDEWAVSFGTVSLLVLIFG